MRLKSLLPLGVAVACLMALAPAEDAFGATAASGPPPTIVTTTPSATIGGLPIASLDD